METQELLKKVRQVEIKTRGISNHLFAGEYHSTFKGRGISFSEFREYTPGDDVRSMAWNVTARFNAPYVKVFEEERELTLMILADFSNSASFGSIQERKRDIITELSAVLGFSALQNNDKVGILIFTDTIELFIPPKKGKKHILRIIRELINFEPTQNKTKISQALEYLNSVIKKKCIVFILSDFISENYLNSLQITCRKHDVIGIRLFDKLEKNFPDLGLVHLGDLESEMGQLIDTSIESNRKSINHYFNRIENEFKVSFNRSGGSTLSLDTSISYIPQLLKFFKSR